MSTIIHDLCRARPRRSGWIYFIAPEDVFRREEALQRVKIGFTRLRPESRLRDLQTGSPVPLELLHYQEGTADDERSLHRRFAAYRAHGEWFDLAGDLRAILEPEQPSGCPHTSSPVSDG